MVSFASTESGTAEGGVNGGCLHEARVKCQIEIGDGFLMNIAILICRVEGIN